MLKQASAENLQSKTSMCRYVEVYLLLLQYFTTLTEHKGQSISTIIFKSAFKMLPLFTFVALFNFQSMMVQFIDLQIKAHFCTQQLLVMCLLIVADVITKVLSSSAIPVDLLNTVKYKYSNSKRKNYNIIYVSHSVEPIILNFGIC